MTPYEALSFADKKTIKSYIQNFASSDNCPMADLKHILRLWNASKSDYLWKLMGEKLIISTPVEYTQSVDEIINTMSRKDLFRHPFYKAVQNIYNRYTQEDNDLTAILTPRNLARNACEELKWCRWPESNYVSFPLSNGKVYKCYRGTKPMKLLRVLGESYGVEGFAEFCNLHSLCLNQKKLKGELCLSIHPLDYMTMSDNNSGWSSCMSWREHGDYCQGTVEMMNSPSVIVAYLKSERDFQFDDDNTWNNKMWRSLFIVDPDFVVSVKNYPYENIDLTKAAIKEIAKLAGWGDRPIERFEYDEPMRIDDKNVYISFETDCMYNDFGCANHWITIAPNTDDIHYYDYSYSGPSECMWCGSIESVGYDQGTDALLCDNCDHRMRCARCGDIINEDYACWYGDEAYCDCCYDNIVEEESENE